jgi:phosphatidate cytidylyltransferase
MSSPRLTFLSRLGSTLLLWAIVLYTVFTGHELGFALVIGGLGLLGLWEFYSMLDAAALPNFRVTGLLSAGILYAGSFHYFKQLGPSHCYDFEMTVLLFFLLVVFGRQMFQRTRHGAPLQTMAYTLFGLMYVPWLFNFVTKLVFIVPGQGHFYVLYLLVVTKFSDMGAYVVGSMCGRHLLVPHISPKKTWEGFFGGLGFALGGSYLVLALMPTRLSAFNWTHATLLGLLLGFAAVLGDLAESIIKRSTGVKDSGRLLPGIGGTLDLIDSLLFTAPLLFCYMRLVLHLP